VFALTPTDVRTEIKADEFQDRLAVARKAQDESAAQVFGGPAPIGDDVPPIPAPPTGPDEMYDFGGGERKGYAR